MTDCSKQIYKSTNPECQEDYIDGYPAEKDRFTFNPADFGFARGNSTDTELAEGLGLPAPPAGDVELLFKFGSGVLLDPSDIEYRYYEGFRLDCNCLLFGCGDATASTDITQIFPIDSCSIDHYIDQAGQLDFNCDQARIFPRLILSEQFSTCSNRFDGTIQNLICRLQDGEIPDEIPESGSYLYVDDYGVIYEGEFAYNVDQQIIDITSSIKDPRVPGEPRQGFRQGNAIFVRGTITICRQIIEVSGPSIIIQAQGCEQTVGYIKTNFICGDTSRPQDDWCYHFDCQIDDGIEIVVCGPRWADVDDPVDEFLYRPDIITDSFDNIIEWTVPENREWFYWIDVWGNEPVNGTGFDPTNLCGGI